MNENRAEHWERIMLWGYCWKCEEDKQDKQNELI